MLGVSAHETRQILASPSTVRWSSAVDSTIDRTGGPCTGLAHKPHGQSRALSAALWPHVSGRRGMAADGGRCRVRAPSSGRRSGPSDL